MQHPASDREPWAVPGGHGIEAGHHAPALQVLTVERQPDGAAVSGRLGGSPQRYPAR